MSTGNEFAYSRTELLKWVNEFLQLDIQRIEHLGTGAVYCQIMDAIYGDVQMNKVRFNTVLEYEYIANYKILQLSFVQHNITKTIPVQKLIKCKFQDNFDFLIFMKKHFDLYYRGNYDPLSRRKILSPTISTVNLNDVVGSKSPMTRSSRLSYANSSPKTSASSHIPGTPASNAARRYKQGSAVGSLSNTPLRTAEKSSPEYNSTPPSRNGPPAILDDLRLSLEGAEKERNFYYDKLRQIELLVARNEHDSSLSGFCKSISNILYAVEEGFVIPNDPLPSDSISNVGDESRKNSLFQLPPAANGPGH